MKAEPISEPYLLWRARAKTHGFTPLWAGLVTLILAPLGYWLLGEGYRGIKYAIILFFAGYLTLGIGSIIGSVLLAADVYRRADENERVYVTDTEKVEYSKHGLLYKGAVLIILLAFAASIVFLWRLTALE